MTLFGKILLTLILVTGAVLIIKGGSKEEIINETPEEVATEETENVSTGAFSGSMKDLVARGGDYKCTFSNSTDVSDSSGTVYISGQRIRGDFTSLAKPVNTNVESHMITDGEFSYVWSDAMPMGLKMKIDTAQTDNSQDTGAFDYNQTLDYSCEAWTVDESMFSLPEDLDFTELPTQA